MKIYQVVLKYQKKGILNEKSLRAVFSPNAPEEDVAELQELFDIVNEDKDIKEEEFVETSDEFSFLRLTSGRYCLCKIIFTEGYLDKFLCHALILDEGCFSFYPSEAVDSPAFLNENCNLENINLQILDKVALSGEYSIKAVSEYVKSQSFKNIREVLKAVVDFKQNNQNIVIIERKKDIPLIAAAVQMAFPIENSHNITFSTIKLNSKVNNTTLSFFNEFQSDSFDLINSKVYNLRFGVVPQSHETYKFIRVIETGYLMSLQILSAFHKYISQFDYKEIDDRINDIYNLFIMLNSDSEVFTSDEIRKVFQFILSYSSSDMLEYLFEKLEPIMNRIIKMADFEGMELITDFLYKVSVEGDKPILLQTAVKESLNIVDHIVIDRNDTDISCAYELYDFIREKIKENPHIFLRYVISQDRITYINALVSHDPGCRKALFYLDISLKSLVELGYTWPQVIGIENIEVFFDTCITQITSDDLDIEDLLKITSINVDIFSHFIILFFDRIQSDSEIQSFSKTFTKILDSVEADVIAEVRRKINELGGGRLLFEEYRNRIDKIFDETEAIDNSDDEKIENFLDETDNEQKARKIQPESNEPSEDDRQKLLIDFFSDYYKSVFSIILDYYKNYFSDALKMYISKLENEYKYNECVRLIKELSNNSIIIDDEAAACLVKGFEEGVKLDAADPELEKMFMEVKKLKKTRNISSYPDITSMADFVIWLKQNTKSDYTIDEILNEHLDIDKLEENRYNKYLSWCLPEVIRFSKTAEDHKKIIHYFQRNEEEKFFDEYINIIVNLIYNEKEKGIKVFQSFVVYFFFYFEPGYRNLGEEAIIYKVRKSIIGIFNNNPRSFLKEFDYSIKKEFSDRGLSMPVQWGQIVSEINSSSKKSGIFGKISKMFRR